MTSTCPVPSLRLPGPRLAIAIVMSSLAVLAGLSIAPTEAASGTDPMALGVFPAAATKAAVQAFEASAGRQMAYIRVYDRWNDTFPDSNTTWMKSTGHSLFLSIKTRLKSGTNLSWQAIADAQPGSSLYIDMQRWATQIKAYQLPIYVTFNHEPDTSNSQASGTPAAYIAAYRKFVTVMRAEGVSNASWAWTTAARNYGSGKPARYAPNYYPGDAYVDVIAIDAYNIYCKTKSGGWSNPWRSLETIIAPFMAFAAQHPGPTLVVAEFGSSEDPADPNAKAGWITAAEQLFKQPGYERFEAISYWNTTSHTYANCDFKIASSAASQTAFNALAADPFYSGSVH
jgi:hypothetical protein